MVKLNRKFIHVGLDQSHKLGRFQQTGPISHKLDRFPTNWADFPQTGPFPQTWLNSQPISTTLRKLVHAINRDFLVIKLESFQLKNFDIFLIFAQNIDCGYTLEPPRRGGSNEYPQSMFWRKNKKSRYTPANPSFSI